MSDHHHRNLGRTLDGWSIPLTMGQRLTTERTFHIKARQSPRQQSHNLTKAKASWFPLPPNFSSPFFVRDHKNKINYVDIKLVFLYVI